MTQQVEEEMEPRFKLEAMTAVQEEVKYGEIAVEAPGLTARLRVPRLPDGSVPSHITMYQKFPGGRVLESLVPLKDRYYYMDKGFLLQKPAENLNYKTIQCPYLNCRCQQTDGSVLVYSVRYPYGEIQNKEQAEAVIERHVQAKHRSYWRVQEAERRKVTENEQKLQTKVLTAILERLAGGAAGISGDEVAMLRQQVANLQRERAVKPRKQREWTAEERAEASRKAKLRLQEVKARGSERGN